MNVGDEKVFSEQREKFARVAALIDAATEIVICAHTNPDGDALGSGLALAQLISQHWEGKHVTNLLADNDPVPRLYRFLPGADSFVRASSYEGDPDLFIIVDLSVASRLNQAQAVLERSAHVAILDHHPSTMPFGDVALIRPDAAAAGVIIAEFALAM